jgi:hypothetical protein
MGPGGTRLPITEQDKRHNLFINIELQLFILDGEDTGAGKRLAVINAEEHKSTGFQHRLPCSCNLCSYHFLKMKNTAATMNRNPMT